jgi:uncharacterized protein
MEAHSPELAERPAQAAGAVITLNVRAAHVAEFERGLRDLIAAAAGHPGHLHAEVLSGNAAPGWQRYHVVYRFADRASLDAWEASTDRHRLVARLDRLAVEGRRLPLTGLEAWFPIPGPAAPPRIRMALLTWLGIWPSASLALWYLAPHLLRFPFLVRTAAITLLLVTALTFLVMPVLVRMAGSWLRPCPADRDAGPDPTSPTGM